MKFLFARIVPEHGDLLRSPTSSAAAIGTIGNSLRGRRGSLVNMLNSLRLLLLAVGAGEALAWPPMAWRRSEPAQAHPPGWVGAAAKRGGGAEAALRMRDRRLSAVKTHVYLECMWWVGMFAVPVVVVSVARHGC